MDRQPIQPQSVIEDLYSNQLNSLMDELYKKISLKDYEHNEKWAYIIVKIKNLDYNSIVLNEVKRRYIIEGWGNIFYKIVDDGEISFQFYFPQSKIGT